MKAPKTETKLLMDCFRELYRESTPSGEFDLLVADASVNDLAGDMYMFSFTVSIPRSS